MTTNKELCTSIEASKLLAETGLMAGVEADGYYRDDIGFFTNTNYTDESTVLSFRHDKILAVLKEKIAEFKPLGVGTIRELITLDIGSGVMGQSCRNTNRYGLKIEVNKLAMELTKKMFFSKSAQMIANAAAKLAHLLWSEGLLKEVKE